MGVIPKGVKNCTKGKACKSACISKSHDCLALLDDKMARLLSKVAVLVEERAPEAAPVASAPAKFPGSIAKSITKKHDIWAREDADEFDSEFTPVLVRFSGTRKASVKWGELTQRSRELGSGSYGTVMESKDIPPVIVKRGILSSNEVQILKKLIGKDIGPELIGAELSVSAGREYNIDLNIGRVAMTKVPGEPIALASGKFSDRQLGDAYLRARANLHREGIAHNDSHTMNILIDDKGKARFVDFGLAQDSRKAALSEALGIVTSRGFIPSNIDPRLKPTYVGDYQSDAKLLGMSSGSKDWPPAMSRFASNLDKLHARMRKDGFSDEEITFMHWTPVRSDLSEFDKGYWRKMTDEAASAYINILYEGI